MPLANRVFLMAGSSLLFQNSDEAKVFTIFVT
jgi:hypothetical protein